MIVWQRKRGMSPATGYSSRSPYIHLASNAFTPDGMHARLHVILQQERLRYRDATLQPIREHQGAPVLDVIGRRHDRAGSDSVVDRRRQRRNGPRRRKEQNESTGSRLRGVPEQHMIASAETNDMKIAWMAQSDPRSRPLVEDFVRYKLCQRGFVSDPAGPPSCSLHTAMRAAGDEFEERFRQAFSEISTQIHVTPGTAYTHFAEVANGLFQGGVNWGRVVAFFVFGAALCAECVNKEMAPLLPRIQDWMVTYIETNLRDWMQSNGGWNGFLALYGDGAIEEARRQREGNWASLKTVLTGAVALGALMTVGALFASK